MHAVSELIKTNHTFTISLDNTVTSCWKIRCTLSFENAGMPATDSETLGSSIEASWWKIRGHFVLPEHRNICVQLQNSSIQHRKRTLAAWQTFCLCRISEIQTSCLETPRKGPETSAPRFHQRFFSNQKHRTAKLQPRKLQDSSKPHTEILTAFCFPETQKHNNNNSLETPEDKPKLHAANFTDLMLKIS